MSAAPIFTCLPCWPLVVDDPDVLAALELELLVLLLLLPQAATVRATARTPSAKISGSLRLRAFLLMTSPSSVRGAL
jgi:hypothetical protein